MKHFHNKISFDQAREIKLKKVKKGKNK